MNAITYKEVFPLLKDNKIWLGYKSLNQDMYFNVTDDYKQWLLKNKKEGSAYKIIDGVVMGRLASACWFSNIDHGKRYEKLQLDTMAHNLKYNKRLQKKLNKDYGMTEYPQYDNYDAIEVPFTECIPSDYDNVMGVPITFMDKYNPNQFEITGITLGNTVEYPMKCIYDGAVQHNKNGKTQNGSKVNTRAAILISNKPEGTVYYTAKNVNGYLLSIYPRVLICFKKGENI